MSEMVRKQIYIRKQQEESLKRISEARGLSEAEIVRQAIDREIGGAVKRSLIHDRSAWEAILEYLEKRKAAAEAGEAYQWRREDAYEERMAHLDRKRD